MTSNTMNHKQAEKLASRILAGLDDAVCVKLKELKDDIERLRDHFKDLKGEETIAGCKTWAEFCELKLHRTDRAVRKMLAGPKPRQSKEPLRAAEQSSASEDEQRSKACKALREYLHHANTPSDEVEQRVADLLRDMFPGYEVTVTISEPAAKKKAAKPAPAAAEEVAS